MTERPRPERNDAIDPALARLVRGAAPDAFAAGFAGRVAARIEAERTASFADALERQFVRIVPFAAAASLLLGAYSWWGGRESADSLLDATLRLPQVSVAAVYNPENLFGTTLGDGR